MVAKNDFVKDAKNVGKVTSIATHGVYIWSATTGQNGFIKNADIQLATKEECDLAVDRLLHPLPVESRAAPQPARPQKAKTFRWKCLECGAKYNGRVCPACNGEDRILNHESDLDPSYLGS